MKTKFAGIVLAAVLASALAAAQGCFSIERARIESNGEEHLFVSNYGWYLFGCVPLVCGNASEDPLFPIVFFRDDVTMEKIQGRFMKRAKETKHDRIYNLSYSNDDSILFEIPGLDFPLPIPYVFTYREMQLSGVMK